MGCSTGIAKLLLFLFNSAFFLFGLALLVSGILLLVLPTEILTLVNVAVKASNSPDEAAINSYLSSFTLVQIAAILFVTIGVFTFVVGFCGCCGAINESKCLLHSYAFCIGFILLVELGLAIASIVFRKKIHDLSAKGLTQLQDKYFMSYQNYTDKGKSASDQITLLFNYVQVGLQCCGIDQPNDVANSTKWKSYKPKYNGKPMVTPLTCCPLKMTPDAFLKTGSHWKSFFAKPQDYLKDNSCPTTKNKGHQISCLKKVVDEVNSRAVIVVAIGIGIAFVEILGIALACCLIRSYDTYRKR